MLVVAAASSRRIATRIVAPTPVPGAVLLDAAADIVDGGEAEPGDVGGDEHPDREFGLAAVGCRGGTRDFG